jgi:hypothetical protein
LTCVESDCGQNGRTRENEKERKRDALRIH